MDGAIPGSEDQVWIAHAARSSETYGVGAHLHEEASNQHESMVPLVVDTTAKLAPCRRTN